MDLEEELSRVGSPTPQQMVIMEERFARAADDRALVDIAYTVEDSPVGRLLLAVSERGVARISYVDDSVDGILADLAVRTSPRIVHMPARLDRVRRELDEYFAGRRRAFDLDLDLSTVGPFGRAVLRATSSIGFGSTASYAEVARRAGNERAVRAAGTALGKNPIPIVVPCHRVLRTGGGLGGYTGGLDRKRALLDLEGVLWEKGKER